MAVDYTMTFAIDARLLFTCLTKTRLRCRPRQRETSWQRLEPRARRWGWKYPPVSFSAPVSPRDRRGPSVATGERREEVRWRRDAIRRGGDSERAYDQRGEWRSVAKLEERTTARRRRARVGRLGRARTAT